MTGHVVGSAGAAEIIARPPGPKQQPSAQPITYKGRGGGLLVERGCRHPESYAGEPAHCPRALPS